MQTPCWPPSQCPPPPARLHSAQTRTTTARGRSDRAPQRLMAAVQPRAAAAAVACLLLLLPPLVAAAQQVRCLCLQAPVSLLHCISMPAGSIPPAARFLTPPPLPQDEARVAQLRSTVAASPGNADAWFELGLILHRRACSSAACIGRGGATQRCLLPHSAAVPAWARPPAAVHAVQTSF